jgi:hypothetical protein
MVYRSGQTGAYESGGWRTGGCEKPAKSTIHIGRGSIRRGIFRNIAGCIWHLYSGRRNFETAEIPVVCGIANRRYIGIRHGDCKIYQDFDGESNGWQFKNTKYINFISICFVLYIYIYI